MSLVPQKEVDGLLLMDKPGGLTSHDIVYRVRRKLQMKRIGHAGTLDPMATGLLIILVGKATKASQYLMGADKVYEGTLRLGITTNSQDADGEVMETQPVPAFTAAQIEEAMNTFLGDQYQTPPMFSAIKVGGVPLYKLARKGEEIEREPRFIRISKLETLGFESPDLRFRMFCTKGTYVRTFAHDLGRKLGCCGHLCALRRIASGEFSVASAITLDAFEALPIAEAHARLVPVAGSVPMHHL
ncbi:MAG TPA: tRNA pseudouridine(55) synthase TruB [Opitutaceae bacterium]